LRDGTGVLLLGQFSRLNLYEVHDALQANGVPSQLVHESEGESVFPEIWVPAGKAEAAKRLVDECFRRTPATGSPWTCRSCCEPNEPGFDLCWSCGNERPR
jgi:hypothetical protein